jgi:predicted O-methyltransferase YrrM
VIRLAWRDVAPGDGPTISTSLTQAETDELRRLAKKGKTVLEVGSAFGYSAISMALAGARVVAVDPHQWLNSLGIMASNVDDYNVSDKVEIRIADSRQIMPTLVALGQKFGLVWIDGDHEASAVAHDVEWARKLLKPTGTLAVHDYDEATCPGVRQALDAWKVPPRLVDTLAVYGPGEW